MKNSAAILFFLGLHALPALAQEPSPTESIGCEPHGDHWHCEAPRPPVTSEAPTTQLPPVVTTTTAAEPITTAPAEDDDEHSEDPGPSPTESVGCEPHGDHWHCEGPRDPVETGTSSDDSSSASSLVPSATDSLTTVTTTTSGTASGTGAVTSTTSSAVVTAGAAAGPIFGAVPVVGLAVFAALGL